MQLCATNSDTAGDKIASSRLAKSLMSISQKKIRVKMGLQVVLVLHDKLAEPKLCKQVSFPSIFEVVI
jgi:hypothetical protein